MNSKKVGAMTVTIILIIVIAIYALYAMFRSLWKDTPAYKKQQSNYTICMVKVGCVYTDYYEIKNGVVSFKDSRDKKYKSNSWTVEDNR